MRSPRGSGRRAVQRRTRIRRQGRRKYANVRTNLQIDESFDDTNTNHPQWVPKITITLLDLKSPGTPRRRGSKAAGPGAACGPAFSGHVRPLG